MVIYVHGLCTHNSVQPVSVKKGPCGTPQCHNPYKRSESFLFLSKTYQTFHFSRFCSKRQVLPHMISKPQPFISLVEGEYLMKTLFTNCSQWSLFPQNSKWSYLFSNVQKQHFICHFWGGESCVIRNMLYKMQMNLCTSDLTYELTVLNC